MAAPPPQQQAAHTPPPPVFEGATISLEFGSCTSCYTFCVHHLRVAFRVYLLTERCSIHSASRTVLSSTACGG